MASHNEKLINKFRPPLRKLLAAQTAPLIH
jgi:hypothetical protein